MLKQTHIQQYSDLRIVGGAPFPIRLSDTIVQEAKPEYLALQRGLRTCETSCGALPPS